MKQFCPNCGESGGEPRTVYSREYQGESPHGGMVEWEDKCCSLCIGSTRDVPDEVYVPVSESQECPF